jgi:hypothetical protein
MSSSDPLFVNVTDLILDLDGPCSIFIVQRLSQLIHISSITRMKLNFNYDFHNDVNKTEHLVSILLRHTSNLHTLEICNNVPVSQTTMTIDELCTMIPVDVKHLQITVKNINEMKMIFDRLGTQLNSITFQFSFVKSNPSAKMIESFLNIKNDLTYRKDDCLIHVWLNK